MTRQCTARSKQTGERCKRTPSLGASVCAMHGGKSLKGPAHPNWIDGRASIYGRLPEKLRLSAEAYATSAELTDLSDVTGMLRMMLEESMGNWEEGGAGVVFAELDKAWRRYDQAVAAQDDAKTSDAIQELQALSERGRRDFLARKESREVALDLRRVSETEDKRRRLAENTMTVDQAHVLFGALAKSIMTHVTEPAAMRGIMDDIARLQRRFTLEAIGTGEEGYMM